MSHSFYSLYTNTNTHVQIFTHIRIYIYIYKHIKKSIHINIPTYYLDTYSYIHSYIHIYMYTYMQVYAHILGCIHIHTKPYAYIYLNITYVFSSGTHGTRSCTTRAACAWWRSFPTGRIGSDGICGTGAALVLFAAGTRPGASAGAGVFFGSTTLGAIAFGVGVCPWAFGCACAADFATAALLEERAITNGRMDMEIVRNLETCKAACTTSEQQLVGKIQANITQEPFRNPVTSSTAHDRNPCTAKASGLPCSAAIIRKRSDACLTRHVLAATLESIVVLLAVVVFKIIAVAVGVVV